MRQGADHVAQARARESGAAERRLSATRLAAGLVEALGRQAAADGGAQATALALALPFAQLLSRFLRFDAADPGWADRDRLVLAPDCAALGAAAGALLGCAAPLGVISPLGFGVAVGLALAERQLAARFGRSLVDHATWVVADGASLASGPVQEAASLAGAWRLGRLSALVTACPGHGALACFAAHGWAVRRVAGDDAAALAAAMSAASRAVRPTLLVCESPAQARAAALFEDGEILAACEAAGRRNATVRRGWLKRLARHASRAEFEAAIAGKQAALGLSALADPPAGSSAQAVLAALSQLSVAAPALTRLPGPPDPAMARQISGGGAVLCGIGLHGGLPYGVQKLEDLPSLYPALREAARLGVRLVLVLVEPPDPPSGLRALLRATDNVLVLRPCDGAESLDCLDIAVRRTSGPAVLLVSEQPAPALGEAVVRARVARGAYLVVEAPEHAARLLASGPDLALALAAAALLAQEAIIVGVVALPAWDLLAAATPAWQAQVLGRAPRVGLENSGGFGWERWLGQAGLFIDTRRHANAADLAAMIKRHLEKCESPWTCG